MIARTLPTLDQMLGMTPSATPPVGEAVATGATPFDQLMATLTLPQSGQQTAPQPGKMTPVSFQPTAPKLDAPVMATATEVVTTVPTATVPGEIATPVLPFANLTAVKAEIAPAPVLSAKIAVSTAKTAAPVTMTIEKVLTVDAPDAEAKAEPAIPATPVVIATPEAVPVTLSVAQPAITDVATILAAAGLQMPAQAPMPIAVTSTKTATPANAEAATALVSPAILQNAVVQPAPSRPAKTGKSVEASFTLPVSDKPVAQPFAVEAKVTAPVVTDQPVVTEIALPKAEAAPVILLHKQTPDAIALPAAAAPASDIVATHTELASQSLETRLDVVHDAQWIDRAAKDIAQLASGEGRLRFRLDPDHLGSLQIDMANGSDGLSMRVTAETEAARVILADAQPRLIAEARAQGVRIAESHVDLGHHSNGSGRQTPQDQTALTNQNQTFEAETAETTARPSNERFA